MILELLVAAGLVAAGAAGARILARRREAGPGEREGEDGGDAGDERRGRDEKKGGRARRTGKRGLRVGDVLLCADTELWLAGCIELDEEGLVARLFPCPGDDEATWLGQLDEAADDLAVLKETSEVPEGPVPESLPIAGRRLSLERRGSADVRAEGEHLPRTSERGSYTILSDAGGRVLVVLDFAAAPRLALSGDRVSKHMVDLLPGGDIED